MPLRGNPFPCPPTQLPSYSTALLLNCPPTAHFEQTDLTPMAKQWIENHRPKELNHLEAKNNMKKS